jgi:hypothetical protein
LTIRSATTAPRFVPQARTDRDFPICSRVFRFLGISFSNLASIVKKSEHPPLAAHCFVNALPHI